MLVFYMMAQENTIRKCDFCNFFTVFLETSRTSASGKERKGIRYAKGMAARSKKDGLVHLLRSESMGKGVRVLFEEDNTVSIELHIIVDAGVNLTAVSSAIMGEVRYAVSNMTGATVRAVDVYVDSMQID